MDTQNNEPTPLLMLGDMDDGERAGEASPTGSAPSPTIDGDVAADEELADTRHRPHFEWTNERIIDLIRFRQSMHAKHDELVKSMSASQLKTNYLDGYEEVRNRYPSLWEVRLSVMFMKYADLLKLWTDVWKIMDSNAAEGTSEITTRIASHGLDTNVFVSLKDNIEARREVNLDPLLAAWDGVLPSRRAGRIVFFLIGTTHREFDAREECASVGRIRKAQDLRYCMLQEDQRYNLATLRLREQHNGTQETIRKAIDKLDEETLDVDHERSKHFNQFNTIHDLIYEDNEARSR